MFETQSNESASENVELSKSLPDVLTPFFEDSTSLSQTFSIAPGSMNKSLNIPNQNLEVNIFDDGPSESSVSTNVTTLRDVMEVPDGPTTCSKVPDDPTGCKESLTKLSRKCRLSERDPTTEHHQTEQPHKRGAKFNATFEKSVNIDEKIANLKRKHEPTKKEQNELECVFRKVRKIDPVPKPACKSSSRLINSFDKVPHTAVKSLGDKEDAFHKSSESSCEKTLSNSLSSGVAAESEKMSSYCVVNKKKECTDFDKNRLKKETNLSIKEEKVKKTSISVKNFVNNLEKNMQEKDVKLKRKFQQNETEYNIAECTFPKVRRKLDLLSSPWGVSKTKTRKPNVLKTNLTNKLCLHDLTIDKNFKSSLPDGKKIYGFLTPAKALSHVLGRLMTPNKKHSAKVTPLKQKV